MIYRNTMFFALILSLLGCASMVKEGAMIGANKHFANAEYEEAIYRVEWALRNYDYSDEEKARLFFIKSSSYLKLGDVASAVSILEYITFKFPETEYGFRCKAILESIENRKNPKEFSI